MLTTVLFILSLSLILSGLIYFNYDNYFNNNSNSNNNNYNNSSSSNNTIGNSTIYVSNTSNINVNKIDDDNGDRSIAVEAYQTGHVIINNGSFTFQYPINRRSLFTVNDTLFSSIDALLSDDYNFIITEASEDNNTVNVQFFIIAITYTGDESEVERLINEDLDYVFSSDYLSQQVSIEPMDFQLSEWRIESLDEWRNESLDEWRNESLDEFKYSSSLLPSTVFNIKVPSYFYFLGDWGKGGLNGDILSGNRKLGNNNNNKVTYTYQAAIARAMNSQANFNKPTAIITLGDNIYNSGVSSTTDSLWNTLFRDVYHGNGNNMQGVKWYPVFGNHDYGSSTGVQAQIDRTWATDDDEWIFPSRNYTRTFLLPDNSKVFVVFIDTTTLSPSETSATNSKGGISTSVQEYRIKDQLYHIEKNLKNIQNEMDQRKPVFSSGQHGDISENIQYLLPLLDSYPVHAYISGHDHMSMHLLKNEGGCHYFVAGAGSMTDSLGTTSKANLLFAGEKYPAFMMTSISKYEAKFSFINHKSETTYSYTLKKSMFKNYKAYDDYVYYASLKNTNTDSISGAILFFILLLFLYFMFSKSQQKKPFESLLLIAETKKTKTSYVSVMKHDNCELDI